MPSSSSKQHRFMEAVAHNPGFAKKVGIPQSVGKDFSDADKGKKFGKGGMPQPDLEGVNKSKTNHGKTALFKKGGNMKSRKEAAHKQEAMLGRAVMAASAARRNQVPPMGMPVRPPMGAPVAMPARPPMPMAPPPGAGAPPPQPGMKKGGSTMKKKMAKGGIAETMGPRTMADDVEKGSNRHGRFGESMVQKSGHTRGKNLGDTGPNKADDGMKRGGKVKKMARGGMTASKRADGIAMKGKTKGTYI